MTRILFIAIVFSTTFRVIQAQDILKQMHSNVKETINGKEYFIHTIKKGQTLYMISKAYGVDVNLVIRENPEVKEGIRANQKIRIPIEKPAEPSKKQSKSPGTVPSEKKIAKDEQEEAPVEKELPCNLMNQVKGSPYMVAIMLPLYLGDLESIDTVNIPADPEVSYRSLHYLQYYEGLLLAIDSLEKSGISLKISVFDVDKDTNKTKKLLRNPELKNMDLIIGLVYSRNFQIVEDFAEKNGITIINPLTERDRILTGHSRTIKVRPSNASQFQQLAEVLADSFRGTNILIIRNGQYQDKDAIEQMTRACIAKDLAFHVVEGSTAAIGKLSRENKNVIIVFSENRVYSLELITRLNEVRSDYDITVAGLPRWDKFEGLESDYLVNLKVLMMAPFFVDYQDKEVKKFVRRFQEKFKTDPGPLAFQGFDQATYFITGLTRYGKNFSRCLPEHTMNLLSMRFLFRQVSGNGMENLHWEIFQHEDYRLHRIDHP